MSYVTKVARCLLPLVYICLMTFFKKHILTIVGLLIGLAGGYVFWYFIGCTSGQCAIKNNPLSMTLYGGLMGAMVGSLLQDLIQKGKKAEK